MTSTEVFKLLSDQELDELTIVLTRAMHRFERHTEYVWEQQSAEYPEYLTLWRETRELIRDVYAVEKERYLS